MEKKLGDIARNCRMICNFVAGIHIIWKNRKKQKDENWYYRSDAQGAGSALALTPQ
jgi:hypothetical protein